MAHINKYKSHKEEWIWLCKFLCKAQVPHQPVSTVGDYINILWWNNHLQMSYSRRLRHGSECKKTTDCRWALEIAQISMPFPACKTAYKIIPGVSSTALTLNSYDYPYGSVLPSFRSTKCPKSLRGYITIPDSNEHKDEHHMASPQWPTEAGELTFANCHSSLASSEDTNLAHFWNSSVH